MTIMVTHVALFDGDPAKGGEEIDRVAINPPVPLVWDRNRSNAFNLLKIDFQPTPRAINAFVAYMADDQPVAVYDGNMLAPIDTSVMLAIKAQPVLGDPS